MIQQTMLSALLVRSGIVTVILVALLLSGCASPSRHGKEDLILWRLEDIAKMKRGMVVLQGSSGAHSLFDPALARHILEIFTRLHRAVDEGPAPELVLVSSSQVNAFAFSNAGTPTIAFTLGMGRLLANDDGAWAALMGHELAHLRLRHLTRQENNDHRTAAASSFAGAVLSVIGIPLAGLASDAVAALANKAYSRDDEREADREGVAFMRKAGFSPEGAIRLQQLLAKAGADTTLPFVSTHPSSTERIDNLQRMIQAGN
jgi:predicted Zn-dependent protease